MNIPEIVTGNNVSIAVQLERNALAFAITGTGSVRALLVSADHKTKYMIDPVDLSPAAPGANWSASLVVVEFTGGVTEDIIYQGNAILEIKVDDASGVGEKTFFHVVRIVTGQIRSTP
jgi:hypothetical protein